MPIPKNNNSIFPLGFVDPLEVATEIINSSVNNFKSQAENKADEIKIKSHAIAEINRIWSEIDKDVIGKTNPSNPDKKASLSSHTDRLNTIDKIIKDQLADSRGIAAISVSSGDKYSSGEAQAAKATVGAYCDSIQADIDSIQNEFKNLMQQASSGMDEIKSLRQFIVNMSTQG